MNMTTEMEKDWETLKKDPVPNMPTERLAEFVMAYCDGQIFTLHNLRDPALAHIVFMPIVFGGMACFQPEDVGTVWEYMNQAGKLGVNGNPIFTSMHVMSKSDWEKAVKAIEREKERRREATRTVLEGLDAG